MIELLKNIKEIYKEANERKRKGKFYKQEIERKLKDEKLSHWHIDTWADLIIRINSFKELTKTRRQLRILFGKWVDEVSGISSKGDTECIVNYSSKEDVKIKKDTFDILIKLTIPISSLPNSITKDGKCRFIEKEVTETRRYKAFVCDNESDNVVEEEG